MQVPTLHLILVTRVDARGIPRRHGTFCQGLRKVSQKLQPLLERGLLAKSAGCREIGVIRSCTSQVIPAAVFHSFGQPTHHRTEHRRLAALPAKIGRGGSEKRFEQGVDVADANIFACDNDQTPPDRAAIECVKRAGGSLRELNLAPADRFLEETRSNPAIASQWIID